MAAIDACRSALVAGVAARSFAEGAFRARIDAIRARIDAMALRSAGGACVRDRFV